MARCDTGGDVKEVFKSNLECDKAGMFSFKNISSLERIENITKRDLSFTCVGGFISS